MASDYPVRGELAAQKVLHYYTLRWELEVYFRVLKSGCKIEELRLETYKRLVCCLALYMIVPVKLCFS